MGDNGLEVSVSLWIADCRHSVVMLLDWLWRRKSRYRWPWSIGRYTVKSASLCWRGVVVCTVGDSETIVRGHGLTSITLGILLLDRNPQWIVVYCFLFSWVSSWASSPISPQLSLLLTLLHQAHRSSLVALLFLVPPLTHVQAWVCFTSLVLFDWFTSSSVVLKSRVPYHATLQSALYCSIVSATVFCQPLFLSVQIYWWNET